MTPVWLNDIVRDFGRQMGLRQFALNDRGAAGLVFENGMRLRLEYAVESIMLSIGLEVDVNDMSMRKLLQLAHPSMRSAEKIRAFLLGNESRFAVRIPEREVSVARLEEIFRGLWQIAEIYRRAVT